MSRLPTHHKINERQSSVCRAATRLGLWNEVPRLALRDALLRRVFLPDDGAQKTGMPDPDYASHTMRQVGNAKALLSQAVKALESDLEDLQHGAAEKPSPSILQKDPHRVFLVHGHDEAARELVARFLERLELEVIILHEQANSGRTIIEKIEHNADVGMAVVLLTPDDVSSKVGGVPEPRVRHNVLLELGYFMGALGRNRVCALKSGDVEIPTDFAGVVWTPMSGEWKRR